MAAFLESSFLPDAFQMRVDHVTALLALLLAITLVSKSYSKGESSYIWLM